MRMSAELRRPRALDAAAMNAGADRRRKNKSSSVRLAILAEASRVRCAALHDRDWQSRASERGKEAKFAESIVAKEISVATTARLRIRWLRSIRRHWFFRCSEWRRRGGLVQATISKLCMLVIKM